MPRAPEPEKHRRLALRAAAILQREGLELPASRLAEALGLNRTTLLYHFPTYTALIEVALIELLTEQGAFVIERIERETHPIERLLAHMNAVHAFHAKDDGRLLFLTQAVAATAGSRTRTLLRATEQMFEAHRRANAERVSQGIADGTVAPCDADALVSLTRALTDGLLIQRVVTRSANDEAVALATTILRGFKRTPARTRTTRRK